jgi:hypothetical protein
MGMPCQAGLYSVLARVEQSLAVHAELQQQPFHGEGTSNSTAASCRARAGSGAAAAAAAADMVGITSLLQC